MGSTQWSNVQAFPDLVPPEGATNLILTFHFYEPYIFTHYKAQWAKHKNYVGPSVYPGPVYDKEYAKRTVAKEAYQTIAAEMATADSADLAELIQIAVRRADELQLPLYCGEFGVFRRGPLPKHRFAWYHDVVQILRKNGIPYANWDYKARNEWGLRLENGVVDEELLSILLTGKD